MKTARIGRRMAMALTTVAAALSVSPAFADPIELTALPGLTITANACYLQSNCAQPGTFSALNVVDKQAYLPGTGGHGWSAGNHGTASSPNWLTLNFGGIYQLTSVWLRFHDNAGAFAGLTNVYNLVAGSTVIGSGTLTDLTGNVAALTDSHTFTGTLPVSSTLTYQVVGGSHWSALDEIVVYGIPATAGQPTNDVPEPASLALAALGLAGAAFTRRRRSA